MLKNWIKFAFVMAFATLCRGNPVKENKYRSNKEGAYTHNNNDGEYAAPYGRYRHQPVPYVHVNDNRDLGKYVHMHIPYDGGYGPYAGSIVPYVHVDVPYVPETTTKKPTTTTKRTTTTTTTTTTTPRNILFNYHDEGGHRILHQENVQKRHKYDHVYLTENGIYGEEQASLHHEGGTHAEGYYEYTGDDGKLYRVNYKSNGGGFMPQGEHIPTPPPIPEAIAKALKYVDDKRKANGEKPLFDERGFRINNMNKDVMAELKSMHMDNMPQDIAKHFKEFQEHMDYYLGYGSY